MQIEVKGRNVHVNDELRELVERKFRKVAAQVSDLARMEVELREERNPAIAESQVASVTLYLKGATLHAEGASPRAAPLDQAVRAGARASGQAPPRQARRRREAREARDAHSGPPQPAL